MSARVADPAAPQPAVTAPAMWPVALGLALAFAALYAAWPVGREFSDALFLENRVAAGGRPYYNAAYLPLAAAWWRLLAPTGIELTRALELFSALPMGALVGCTALWLGTLGASRASAAFWAALVGLSAVALFFSGIVEVHALQGLFALGALASAERASRVRTRFALPLLCFGAALAVAGHISHLLLLPGLWLLARRRAPGLGVPLGPRELAFAALLGAALGAGAWFLNTEAGRAHWHGSLQWLGTFGFFAGILWGGLMEHGPARPSDVGLYWRDEWLVPVGLLALGPLLALVRLMGGARGSAVPAPSGAGGDLGAVAGRAALASLPAFLILPQTGVLERGGYTVSYLALLALLGAYGTQRGPAAAHARGPLLLAAAVLLAAQALLAAFDRRAFLAHEPPTAEWVAFAREHAGPEDSLYTASLAKFFHADAAGGIGTLGYWRLTLDILPGPARRKWQLDQLTEALTRHMGGGRLWLDAALFDVPPRRRWQRDLREILFETPEFPLVVERVQGDDPRFALLWVRIEL